MVSLQDIRAAHTRIGAHIRHTPVLRPVALQVPVKSPNDGIVFKLENLQVSGSFKARGALNKTLSLSPSAMQAGVVTASGGNHGLAVAYVGHSTGVPATIYLPSSAPQEKVDKIERWGARTVRYGQVWDEANEAAIAYAREQGALYIHPFADEAIIAGQGTVGLEVFQDAPDVDVMVVAIGGGGLISGVGVAAKAHGARVIGVEPVGAPTLYESKRAGEVVTLDAIRSRVGTLSPLRSAPLNVQHVMDVVDEIVLVTDDEMEAAADWLWFELGVRADLSGAAATAALLTGRAPTRADETVCAVVCGAGYE